MRVRGWLGVTGLVAGLLAVAQFDEAQAAGPPFTEVEIPFVTESPWSAGGAAMAGRPLDIDGDGRDEIPGLEPGLNLQTPKAMVGRWDGHAFTSTTIGDEGVEMIVWAAGDVDGDHTPDLLGPSSSCARNGFGYVRCGETGYDYRPAMAKGHGDGTFDPPVQLHMVDDLIAALPFGFPQFFFVDLTHDGVLDMVMGGAGVHTVHLLRGQASGGFAAPELLATDLDPGGATGDFNGDGGTDLMAVRADGTRVVIVGGETPSLLEGPERYHFNGQTYAHGVDLNGDGLDDLYHATGQYNLSRGDGSFGDQQQLTAFLSIYNSFPGDFDGDGDIDVVFLRSDGSTPPMTLELARGNGDGTFAAPEVVLTKRYIELRTLGDFDGNGIADVHILWSDSTPFDPGAGSAVTHRVALLFGPAGPADADHDGIADDVDVDGGTGSASAFDDHAGTTGAVLGLGGTSVAVTDAAAPDGVRVVVTGTAPAATLTVCGFTVHVVAGSDITFTCGSVTAEVVAGAAVVDLPGGGAVRIGVGATAKVSTTSAGGSNVVVSVGTATITGADGTVANLGTGPARELCYGRVATIVGTNSADKLVGTKGADVIVALGGDDKVEAGGGDDVVCAGDGDDRVEAGDGNDTVDAGRGNDRVEAGAGNDRVDGGAGNDRIEGGGGSDLVDGGPGTDRCEVARTAPATKNCEA